MLGVFQTSCTKSNISTPRNCRYYSIISEVNVIATHLPISLVDPVFQSRDTTYRQQVTSIPCMKQIVFSRLMTCDAILYPFSYPRYWIIL